MNEEQIATPEPKDETPVAETSAPAEAPAETQAPAPAPEAVPPPAAQPSPAPSSEAPCACGKKGGCMPVLAAVAAACLLVVLSFFCCGKSPAGKCLSQTRQFLENAESGRIDRIFAQLPPSCQADMRETVQLFAETFGEKFFSELTGVAAEGSRFIDKNRKELLAMLVAQADEEEKKVMTEKNLDLVSDVLDNLASKWTYSRLSKGDAEGMLDIGYFHKALAESFSLWKEFGEFSVDSAEIEDEEEEDMPVVLLTVSTMRREWDDEACEVKKVSKPETIAIGFTEEDGVWFPAWFAPDRKAARQRAERNRDEWVGKLWRKWNRGTQQVLRHGRDYSAEIGDVTFDLGQIRKDLKKWNEGKSKGSATLEDFIKELGEDMDALGRDVERLSRAMGRSVDDRDDDDDDW